MAWSRNIPVASNWCITDLDNWQPFYDLLEDVRTELNIYISSCSFYSGGLAELTPSAFRCISGPASGLLIPRELVSRCLTIMEYMVDKSMIVVDTALDYDRMENFLFEYSPDKFFDLATNELPSGTSSTLLDAIETEYIDGSPAWYDAMAGCVSRDIPNTIYALCEAIRKNFAVFWSQNSYNKSASGQPEVIRNDMDAAEVARSKYNVFGSTTGTCSTALSSASSTWDSTSWSSHFSPTGDPICVVDYSYNASTDRYTWSADWLIEKFELSGLSSNANAVYKSFEYRHNYNSTTDVFFDPIDSANEKTVQNIKTETVSGGNWTSDYVLDGETDDLSPYDENPPVNCSGGIPQNESAICNGGINLVMELEFDEP